MDFVGSGVNVHFTSMKMKDKGIVFVNGSMFHDFCCRLIASQVLSHQKLVSRRKVTSTDFPIP